ncbi:FG-GAP repeat protein [Peribacillus sp. FSL H8-0477]|uniref:FG-GAP repeat protein n=1 Tax=Peribacillus sp. FSL H8-0477 TaxID=2921388 RepID=UPI0030FBE1AB
MNKKAEIFKYLVFIVAVLFACQAVAAQGKSSQDEKILYHEKKELTGDKKKDAIIVKGIQYENGSDFYKEIILMVTSKGVLREVPLSSGCSPTVSFADLNHDGVKDVLVTVPAFNHEEGDSTPIEAFAFTFKDDKLLDLSVPPAVQVTSQYLNDYKAVLKVDNHKPIVLDVKNRRKEYEELGLYQEGILNEETELMIDSYYSLKTYQILGRGKNLEGRQRINGIHQQDSLADLVSKWHYEKDGWRLVDVKIKPVQMKKK